MFYYILLWKPYSTLLDILNIYNNKKKNPTFANQMLLLWRWVRAELSLPILGATIWRGAYDVIRGEVAVLTVLWLPEEDTSITK